MAAASEECVSHAAALEPQWPAIQDASFPRDLQAVAAEVATAAAAAAGASSAQESAIAALRAALRLQDDEYVRALWIQVPYRRHWFVPNFFWRKTKHSSTTHLIIMLRAELHEIFRPFHPSFCAEHGGDKDFQGPQEGHTKI